MSYHLNTMFSFNCIKLNYQCNDHLGNFSICLKHFPLHSNKSEILTHHRRPPLDSCAGRTGRHWPGYWHLASFVSCRESLHLVNGKGELQRYSPSMMRGVNQQPASLQGYCSGMGRSASPMEDLTGQIASHNNFRFDDSQRKKSRGAQHH